MSKTTLLAAAAGSAIATAAQAYADDAGDKSEEFSDSKKMDKLMDMIGDACAKMDAVGSRMDGFEERMAKADARLDALGKKDEDEDDKDKEAEKKDASESEDGKEEKKDAEQPGDKEAGDPKEPAADKKKDAKKDGEDEDDKEEKKDAKADSVSRADFEASRAEIARIAAALPKALTADERARFAAIQEAADPSFQAFGDRAGPPLDGETELAYRRRLLGKLQKHSPQWKDARLTAIADDASLEVIGSQIYADSIAAARRGADLPAGQLRRVEKNSGHGHTIYEYEGDSPASWMNGFAGNHQKSTGDFRRPV